MPSFLLGWKLYAGIAVIVMVSILAWRVNHAFNEAAKVEGLEQQLKTATEALEAFKIQCAESKKPANEANDYDYKNTKNSLTLCLNQLRKSPNCVPISRPPSRVEISSGQPTSGITVAAIIANNIECQADRDGLNAAKIWAQGYEKYRNGN